MKKFIKTNNEILLLSFAISFMVFIHEQINVFSSNIDDMWFDIYQLFPLILIEFIIVFLAIGIVLYLIKKFKKKLYKILYLIIFSLFISLYVEGNFLTKFLPSLEGNVIDWSQYTIMKIVSAFVWIIPLVIVFILLKKIKYKKLKRYSIYTVTLIILMLSVSLVSMGFRDNVFNRKENVVNTKVNIDNASSNKNFYVIMLDTINGYDFDRILSNLGNKNAFDDFTYYEDAMSSYPYTKFSVPQILTGDKFLNQESFQAFQDKSIDNSKLFDKLKKDNYSINLYMPMLSFNGNYSRIDNMTKDGILRKKLFIKEQAKITLFKFLPYFLKNFSHIETFNMNKCKETTQGIEVYNWGTRSNYFRINESNLNKVDNNFYGFYHFEGGHIPFNLDSNFNVYNDKETTQIEKETAALKLAEAFINRLKDANVYDNSIIIIASDHGYNKEKDLIKRGRPLLLIKGYDEHHKMIVSDKKVSYEYLLDAYMDLLDNKKSNELFNDIPDLRYYYTYDYNDDTSITEYVLTGKRDDTKNLKPTGKKYILK